MGGILSFLGGTAFRWLFGEVIGFFKARQEHAQELERMRLSADLERARAELQRQAIQQAADMGVRIVEAQSAAAAEKLAGEAFLAAVQGANDAGKRADWIGAWNACIRPLLATVSIVLLVGQAVAPQVFVLTALTLELICAVLGVFVGGRIRANGA
jgi:hypothetical protein